MRTAISLIENSGFMENSGFIENHRGFEISVRMTEDSKGAEMSTAKTMEKNRATH